MRLLCDSNIWIALAARRHPHHETALAWWGNLPEQDEAIFCRATQQAFLRLLTTQTVMREEARTNVQAWEVLRTLRSDDRTVWQMGEPPDLEARWLSLSASDTASPKLWMDAYLAAFALGFGLRLITFDRGFERFRKNGLDLLVLEHVK